MPTHKMLDWILTTSRRTMDKHVHDWKPAVILWDFPGMMCNCGEWAMLEKREFWKRFKCSFLKLQREMRTHDYV